MASSFSSSRQKCHQISLEDIKDATDNFDERNILGQGGEGKVYLAAIKLGWKKTEVAVKHLKPNSEEFEKEIKIVSNIQHPNLVSLLGYCDESGQKILLYEFMEKGSLSSYLKKKSTTSLSWQQRLRICLDAARGLQHLHAETNEFPKGIIHRDVKPDNILLDHNWVAKISDFGMFKLSHVDQMQSTMITNLKGTGGYYAPEYIMYRSITRKIDVYAFGVVLFQVLCLKMPWDRGDESYYCSDDEDLGFWSQQNVESRIKEEICDDSLKAFTAIVGKSLKRDPKKRPTMDEVVLDLEISLNCQKHEDEAKQLRAAAREFDEQSTRVRPKSPSILSAEFVRVSLHDVGDMDASILLKSKAWATLSRNGEDEDEDVKLHEEDTTNVQDRFLPPIIDLLRTENLPAVLRIYCDTLIVDMEAAIKLHEEDTTNVRDCLLPLIIDLLRTENLPAVLRIYCDTLIADMEAAIKTVVAELLPVLVGRPSESEIMPGERIVDADGGGSSLSSKLRSLSCESFVQLMSTIFKTVRAHLVRAAEVKKAIEWLMSNLDGHYAADSVAVAIAQGALAVETAMESDAQIRADVLRENTEAVFSACDLAHGRWAELLRVRAILHSRLKLQEFLHIYNISLEFIAATEKIGGRLGYSIQGTLQSQAKSFVDFQHESRMTKIKVVLDQETWVEVDVPTEFQAIVTSLFCSESLVSGNSNDYSGELQTGYHDVVDINDTSSPITESSVVLSSQRHIPDRSSETNEASADSNEQINNVKTKEHGTSSSPLLVFKGVGYHMVNCGLILLKMLSEYIDMNTLLPALSLEVIHSVVEILKFFNARICQLVLGACAMQVSGLKSITSKHLAMASQVISFMHDIIPEIRRVLFLKVPETQKALLLSEIEQVSQDFKVHRDEIHTKLVQIMRERLLFHLSGLPQIVESWNRSDDIDALPSQFARSLTKEVGYLQRVLSRTLQEVYVQEIFREIVIIFHLQISEAFSQVEISTPQAKERLYRDLQHILGCIKSLPSVSTGNSDKPQNWGQLDELLAHRFSNEAGQ